MRNPCPAFSSRLAQFLWEPGGAAPLSTLPLVWVWLSQDRALCDPSRASHALRPGRSAVHICRFSQRWIKRIEGQEVAGSRTVYKHSHCIDRMWKDALRPLVRTALPCTRHLRGFWRPLSQAWAAALSEQHSVESCRRCPWRRTPGGTPVHAGGCVHL